MERPYILINFALSADGKIGTAQKGPSRFTSPADLKRLLLIRKRADAILVGRGTLEADNMSLTIPSEENPVRQPLRCIVSRQGRFDGSHKVFHSEGGDIHLIATEAQFPPPDLPLHAEFHQTSLCHFLTHAKQNLGVETLLCEGGGMLVQELFAHDLIDEINLTIAGHTLIGGGQSPTITGIPANFLPSSLAFHISQFESNEHDELFVTWMRAR